MNDIYDWSQAEKMVRVAKLWFDEQRQALDGFLRESNARLSPLSDPLTTDLGSHRWLRVERETAYSDWFAWVIRQLPSTKSLFDLFGLPIVGSQHPKLSIDVDREVAIQTRQGKTRYLDVVISLSTQPCFVVEIKKRGAEDEEQKLKDYCEWADEHRVPYRLLLGAETGKDEALCGFKPRQWAAICIQLRRFAHDIHQAKGILAAAMVLAFVGAVEQNLLGLSRWNTPAEAAFSRDWPKMADHIRRFLGTEDNMEIKNEVHDTARSDLVTRGISSYLDVMAATKEFERQIMEESHRVLASSLHDLAAAARVPLQPDLIEDYRNPDSIKDDAEWRSIPTYAWLAVKIKAGTYTIYCGLCWDKRVPYAMVTLGFPNRRLRDAASSRLKEKGFRDIRDDFYVTELCFCEKIDAEPSASLSEKLKNLIIKWIQALNALNGAQGLQEEIGQSA